MDNKSLEFWILKTSSSTTINGSINFMEVDQEQQLPHEAYISFLPNPILSEILSRIPARTVFGCMAVSKPWLSVLDNIYFAKEHFSKAQVCPMLVFDDVSFGTKSSSIIMHLVEGERVSDFVPTDISSKLVKSKIEISKSWLQFPKPQSQNLLQLNTNATSCEGIICFPPRYRSGRDNATICNPITGEYVAIDVSGRNELHISIFIGLGFSKVDRKFKLLRLTGKKNAYSFPLNWWLEVCVIGRKGWRNVESSFMAPADFSRKVYEIVSVDGMVYWRYYSDPLIFCFNCDSDVFHVLRVPIPNLADVDGVMPISVVTKNIHIGVLKDSLCVSLVCPKDGRVNIWIVGRNGVGQYSWNKVLDIETPATHMEHSGALLIRGHYRAVKYLENGKVLLHDWQDTFLIYDPVTKIEKLFRVLGHSYCESNGTCSSVQVIGHKPSIMPLRDILNMEDSNVMAVRIFPRRGGTIRGLGLRRSSRLQERGLSRV